MAVDEINFELFVEKLLLSFAGRLEILGKLFWRIIYGFILRVLKKRFEQFLRKVLCEF